MQYTENNQYKNKTSRHKFALYKGKWSTDVQNACYILTPVVKNHVSINQAQRWEHIKDGFTKTNVAWSIDAVERINMSTC